MSEKKYVVPEGMLRAFDAGFASRAGGNPNLNLRSGHDGLEAVLKWQAENPKVPTEADCRAMQDAAAARREKGPYETWTIYQVIATEWVKRMFLAPEDPFERDCADLIGGLAMSGSQANAIREAYERGRKSK